MNTGSIIFTVCFIGISYGEQMSPTTNVPLETKIPLTNRPFLENLVYKSVLNETSLPNKARQNLTMQNTDNKKNIRAAPAFDYRLTGQVESVYYYNRDKCYIAVNDVESTRNNYFHSSSNIDLCYFAERAKTLGIKVILDATIDGGSSVSNDAQGISYADTNAKFWT